MNQDNQLVGWTIFIISVISLSIPLLILLYVYHYDDIINWFIFYNHEKEIISTYQKIVQVREARSKKHD